MTEKPTLPAHYAQKAVSDIAPDDIYYPKQRIIELDDSTREVFIDEYTVLKESSRSPKKLLGRVGLMRVYGMGDDGSDIRGIIIDARYVKFNNITTTFFYPKDPSDESQRAECEELRENCTRPLAVLALDEDMKEVYSGNENAKSYMDYLTKHTDDIHKKLYSKVK